MKKKFTAYVDDDAYEIEVKNERNEHLGNVFVNPMDVNIIVRLKEARKEINRYIEEAQKAATDAPEDKGEEYARAAELIRQIDEKIREQVNYIFNYDVSSVVFGKQHCLTSSGGKYLVERMIDAFLPVFEKIRNIEQEASKKRLDKYVGDLK